mmetsp:Transcript_132123/g.368322  ORF Transcript_132123/g.368322 Transcript_132123/m.368322 type:complete len:221 (-) Transcript_132123:145-807(-)
MTGRTAAGSSTTLHMLSTIKQHVRFTLSALSCKPRVSTGNMMARAGVSTFCTKTQPASLSTHLWVLSMDWAASTTASRNGSKSLLPVHAQIAVMHSIAAAFTSFLMSQVNSATGATRSTSLKPMALGALPANCAIICKVASFCGGLAFTPRPASRAGISASRAKGLNFASIAFEAASAASFTFFDLSPVASMILSNAATRKACASVPFSAANAARPSKAA